MRFGDRLLREGGDPGVAVIGAQVQQPRQRGDQRIERLQVAAEESADDCHVGTPVGSGIGPGRARRLLAAVRRRIG